MTIGQNICKNCPHFDNIRQIMEEESVKALQTGMLNIYSADSRTDSAEDFKEAFQFVFSKTDEICCHEKCVSIKHQWWFIGHKGQLSIKRRNIPIHRWSN